MLFNSYTFLLVFFPIVTLGYFWLPHRARWAWLLGASSVFYMAFVPKYILILALTIAVDYIAAIRIEDSKNERVRKAWLVGSVLSTCLILFFFKYFNFFNDNVRALANWLHWNYSIESLKIVLPIGLSFHTFQSLSYVIEVYRGNQKPERHLGIYSLYVMFYPQLVAGPIERPQNLLHQFREPKSFDYERAGARPVPDVLGAFQKDVHRRSPGWDRELRVRACGASPGFSLILATVFFAIQVYCDFSGYSDVALGSAQVMGFKLMENFDRPYSALSLSDFWRRWHISLSTWLRDYVYDPLAMSWRHGGRAAIAAALFITFLVSGIWHGAAWTFVIWGALHGLGLAAEIYAAPARKRLSKQVSPGLWKFSNWAVTFGFVCFSYIFFRAANLSHAVMILRGMVTHWGSAPPALSEGFGGWDVGHGFAMGHQKHEVFHAWFCIVGLEIAQRWIAKPGGLDLQWFRRRPVYVRWALYYASVGVLIWASYAYQKQDFIYFQF